LSTNKKLQKVKIAVDYTYNQILVILCFISIILISVGQHWD